VPPSKDKKTKWKQVSLSKFISSPRNIIE